MYLRSRLRFCSQTNREGAGVRQRGNAKATGSRPPARPPKAATKKPSRTAEQEAEREAGEKEAAQEKGWAGRVTFSHGHKRFALVPHEVLTSGGDKAVDIARKVFPDAEITPTTLEGAVGYVQLKGVPSPLRLVAELERAGIVAQPNHVFFMHSSDCCCGPHPSLCWGACGGPVLGSPAYASPAYASPAYASAVGASPAYASPAYASPAYASPAYASPAYASPAYASPAYASPAYASPAYASPAYASPAYASPAYASGHRHSSARPAVEPYVTIAAERLAQAAASSQGATVVVLDTGLASTTVPARGGQRHEHPRVLVGRPRPRSARRRPRRRAGSGSRARHVHHRDHRAGGAGHQGHRAPGPARPGRR